tara:strand:+ start:128 stop:490 length:363 start_codon:yes stop_codon:yes gene_type:complete
MIKKKDEKVPIGRRCENCCKKKGKKTAHSNQLNDFFCCCLIVSFVSFASFWWRTSFRVIFHGTHNRDMIDEADLHRGRFCFVDAYIIPNKISKFQRNEMLLKTKTVVIFFVHPRSLLRTE